jgi:hypothetical protein
MDRWAQPKRPITPERSRVGAFRKSVGASRSFRISFIAAKAKRDKELPFRGENGLGGVGGVARWSAVAEVAG